jgi:hypothetical protein
MRRRPAFIVALLLCAGCTAAARPPAPTCPVVPQLTLPDVQSQIDTYIASGRYAADFAVVADSAKTWLEEEAPKKKRPAIETAQAEYIKIVELKPSPPPMWVIAAGSQVGGLWGNFVKEFRALDRATATVALVQRARELGVAVFFITGRPPELRAATERNLREQGYTGKVSSFCRPVRTSSAPPTSRRRSAAARRSATSAGALARSSTATSRCTSDASQARIHRRASSSPTRSTRSRDVRDARPHRTPMTTKHTKG